MPTLRQYFVIALALLACGLSVRAWIFGANDTGGDDSDELPVIVLRHTKQSSDRPGNSISTASAISTRFSTENSIQPVAAQGESIVWESESMVAQFSNHAAKPVAHSKSSPWPKIIEISPSFTDSHPNESQSASEFATPQSKSKLRFPRILQSGLKPPSDAPKEMGSFLGGDQQVVIANQYAGSGGARNSGSRLAEQNSFSSTPPPPPDADDGRTVGPVVIQNPMNQIMDRGLTNVVAQQSGLNSSLAELKNDFSISQIEESPEIESVAKELDELAAADDFFGSDPFVKSEERDSIAFDALTSASSSTDHDGQQPAVAEIAAQTEANSDAFVHGNQFAFSVDTQFARTAAGELTNPEINNQESQVAVEVNDPQPAYPPNRFASVASEPGNRPTKKSGRKKKQLTPGALVGAESFVLAAQPPANACWQDNRPQVDPRAVLIETVREDFAPDAIDERMPYAPYHQMEVYEGKTLYANQRPLIELGRPWYQLGQLSPGSNILGKHNNLVPQFLVFGDFRSAFASNSQNDDSTTQMAFELNLDFDLRLTSTGRFHMFMSPLDNGVVNTGYNFDEDEWVDQYDANIDFGYFEGDLGAMVGGFINKTLPFDLPYTLGVIPLLFQNGIWMEDAILGVAATIPARSSARLDISNMDVTFFAGFDKVDSPAFVGDDSAARLYGIASFIEALNGYFELDYAYLEDRTLDNRSYHNLGMAYSRRYGRLVSNSTRIIINAGQSTDVVDNSADGTLLLSENTLITGSPLNVLPYCNFFAGFDRPQSAARAAQAGGILRNTGILFESDGMTNYPTLDATGNDTVGGALGLNLLANDFRQQLVLEMAFLDVMGNSATRIAAGKQYGIGARYQLPLNNSVIFRTDAMYGFFEDDTDVHGVRMELRKKF